MGVPKFFRWISERYPCLSEIVREYQIPTFDNLYLDMNGIIHTCSHPNDFDPHFRISEEKIFKDIFHYIEVLFRMIQPQKLFFMAVDGVAPRAKMNQQRGRRFRSAKEAEVLEKKAQERGEKLPSEERFDSNCITPGTVFMARLHEQLKYFVTYKVSTDPLWQKCTIILSGQETPGEGEHKIMDYIRYMKSQTDYDSNTRHCLYGLDADLIMLGLCSHEPHFSLLREEVKFVRSKQKRTTAPEEQKFFLLHLSLLREYLELEFVALKTTLSFPFDLEKIIDDWVLMGFLVGNDFIPPLPDMHIANGALPVLYQAYIQVLPTLGGYINENGTLNLERFEKYMQKLSAFDVEQFRETYADLKYFEGKTGRIMGASKERPSFKNKDSNPNVSTVETIKERNEERPLGNADDTESLGVEVVDDKNVPILESAQSSQSNTTEVVVASLEETEYETGICTEQAEENVLTKATNDLIQTINIGQPSVALHSVEDTAGNTQQKIEGAIDNCRNEEPNITELDSSKHDIPEENGEISLSKKVVPHGDDDDGTRIVITRESIDDSKNNLEALNSEDFVSLCGMATTDAIDGSDKSDKCEKESEEEVSPSSPVAHSPTPGSSHSSEGQKDPDAPKKKYDPDLAALIKGTNDLLLDGSNSEDSEDDEDDDDDDEFYMEFRQHKRDYYMNKLEYSTVTEKVLRDQAEGFVRAIQWNLNYYYNGVCSWSWFYPHHYAPYISDVKNFSNLKLEYDMGEPFLPFQQLLAVLPAASKKLLPEPYQALMVNTESPIIDYYPSQFKTDLNGKKQDWEAVVLIPFIDESVLLKAMEPINKLLSQEETQRNSRGPALVYTFTEEDLGKYNAPEYFPSLPNHHAQVKELWRKDIFVEENKIVRGLCSGAVLDVYFPGFPTMKHLKYSSSLQKKKVKVFEMPSRGDNMILKILNEKKPYARDIAREILGRSIYVEWPHLIEARVNSVTTKEFHYSLEYQENGAPQAPDVKVETVKAGSLWTTQKNNIEERYINHLGVDIGHTDILVHCTPIVGRKYVFGPSGRITLEKQWAKNASTYALQATVKDISVHNQNFTQYKTLDEVFPPKSVCFLLGHPHYGSMGEVKEATGANVRAGRVKVSMTVTLEPPLDPVKERHFNIRINYMPGSTAAQRLAISSHLLSRITGTIYIVHGTRAELSENKTNVGLNLKFNKKNEEIPGYTKKDNGLWLYSHKAVELVANYIQTFPDLFDYLSCNTGNDVFFEDEIFPTMKQRVHEIATWLKQQPFYKVEKQGCGAQVVEPEVVEAIEKTVDEFCETSNRIKTVSMQVKPYLLYKSSLHVGSLPPDTSAIHNLFDRVVNARESHTVPLGLKGTIIGIHRSEKEADTMYDIVFDKPFAGGMALNCSANRGYRVPSCAIINLSHGQRMEQVKANKPITLPLTTQSSATLAICPGKQMLPQQQQLPQQLKYQPSQQASPGNQNAVSSHPNSAFASWHNQRNSVSPTKKPFGSNFSASSSCVVQSNVKPQQSWRVQEPPPAPGPASFQLPSGSKPVPLMQLHTQPPSGLPSQSMQPQPPQPHVLQQMLSQQEPSDAQRIPNTCSGQSEFQMMWSELQGLSKPNTSNTSNTSSNIQPISQPSQNRGMRKRQQKQVCVIGHSGERPFPLHGPQLAPPLPEFFSMEVNDTGTELLKKMLRIPEESSEKTPLNSTQQSTKLVSVQDIFEHARLNEAKVAAPENASYCLQLLQMFQMEGLGIPRYNYISQDDQTFIAQVCLPNMRSFTGERASSKEQASENAAKVAVSQLNLERTATHNTFTRSSQMNVPLPLTNKLPSPPQQWCWPQNQRYHNQQQSKQDWRVRNDTSGHFTGQPIINWQMQQPQPQPSHQMPPFILKQSQVRTPPRTNWRDESRVSSQAQGQSQGQSQSQFVPLQAVKQQRSRASGHSAGPASTAGTAAQPARRPQSQQLQQLQQLQQQIQQHPQELQLQPQRSQPARQIENTQPTPTHETIVTTSEFVPPKPLAADVSNLPSGSSKVNNEKAPRQKKSRIAANFQSGNATDKP